MAVKAEIENVTLPGGEATFSWQKGLRLSACYSPMPAKMGSLQIGHPSAALKPNISNGCHNIRDFYAEKVLRDTLQLY